MIHKMKCALACWLLIPAVAFSAEIREVEWIDSLHPAFAKAMEQGKPLVVYFDMKSCEHCTRLKDEVLSSSLFNELGDRAVFARVDIEVDDEGKNVSKLVENLGLDRFPVLSVIHPTSVELKEINRVTGYFPLQEYMGHFTPMLAEAEESIAAEKRKAHAADSTIPKPLFDETISPTTDDSPTGICTVADMAVAKALQKLGYKVETFKQSGGTGCTFKFMVTVQGTSMPFWITHIYGRTIAIDVPLSQVEDETHLNSAALLDLLEANYLIFPAQFSYDRNLKQLKISQPIDQDELLTSEQFDAAIQKVLNTAIQRRDLWQNIVDK